MRTTWVVLRLVVALGVVAAVAAQVDVSVTTAPDGDGTGSATVAVLVNYASYFTIDSSVLAVVVLVVGATRLAAGRADTAGFALARAAVVTYAVLIGVVYNLLLRGIPAQSTSVGWANELLHVVLPVYALLDWVLAPGRRPLPSRQVGFLLVFPVGWLVYTLVRGPFAVDPYAGTDYWYPYPFLNPVTVAGGYRTVLVYVVALTAVVVAFGLGTIRLSRGRPRGADAPADVGGAR